MDFPVTNTSGVFTVVAVNNVEDEKLPLLAQPHGPGYGFIYVRIL